MTYDKHQGPSRFPLNYDSMMAQTTGSRWRFGFYTQRRWRLAFHRWSGGGMIVPASPGNSPPRTFDSILSIGPLRWRIYREHPWTAFPPTTTPPTP
jgi:hypothetical protein